MNAIPLALYVHMPWCVRKCPYCDFNSHQRGTSAPPRSYIDALILDLERELAAVGGRTISTVFFGGGTPSLFPPEEFDRFLGALHRLARVAADAEVTLEANPGTVERGRFSGYRDAGINRVSVGAQSFAPGALARLGRIHSAEDTQRAVEELHAAGLANFNLDLMYALPEQTLEEALEDVRRACALRPAHISHYQLTLEPGTVFHARPPSLPDEDAAFVMQRECQAALAGAGFAQYEVSAYARAGARCRHNLNYWGFGDYVGIGAGAHGKLTFGLPDDVLRTEKPRQPREYQDGLEAAPHANANPGANANADTLAGANTGAGAGANTDTGANTGAGAGVGLGAEAKPLGARRRVPRRELPFEFMLNALRLNEGFALRAFEQRTGLAVATIEPALRRASDRGLIEATAGGWRPTELGSRFLNDLQGGFLE